MKFNAENPITERGDIITLKKHFDGDWEKFIYAWAMREPEIVDAFYENGFEGAKQVKVKYEYLPTRLIRYMKPEVVETWDTSTVAKLLQILFMEEEDWAPKSFWYEQVMKWASKLLHGVGKYSQEHLVRTACLMMDEAHPSNEFVIMGGGADEKKYQIFRDNGINNMKQFNEALKQINPDYPHIDAGDLAYLLCMCK